MQNTIFQHFTRVVHLSKEETDLIHRLVDVQHYPKKTILVQEGEKCKYISYVRSGCTRVYSVDDYGLENNVFFTLEDDWTADLKSFLEQSPARFFLQTLEASEIWHFSKANFDELLEKIPKLEKWLRTLFQEALISLENRISYKSSLKAEERYLKFLEKYPTLENRIPQRQIASYLGISPEFLSNLKSKMLKKEKYYS